jgi:hypothetical protein
MASSYHHIEHVKPIAALNQKTMLVASKATHGINATAFELQGLEGQRPGPRAPLVWVT